MNPNQALWEKGNFSQIAGFMRESGEELVSALGVTSAMRVLDVGCGDGTTALPSARAGASVLGVDISRPLVAAANARAREAGLANLKVQEGDACNLDGVPDASFDLAMSIFGAMFAPKPFEVAKSMVRVTKPGGRVVMGNWIPGDPTFVSQLLKVCAGFTPPPPEGFISPMLWGVEKHIVERFGQAGIPAERIAMTPTTFWFLNQQSPERFIELFRDYYGLTMNAYDAARKNGKEADLHRQLVELANSKNEAANGGTRIPATYLLVTVRR